MKSLLGFNFKLLAKTKHFVRPSMFLVSSNRNAKFNQSKKEGNSSGKLTVAVRDQVPKQKTRKFNIHGVNLGNLNSCSDIIDHYKANKKGLNFEQKFQYLNWYLYICNFKDPQFDEHHEFSLLFEMANQLNKEENGMDIIDCVDNIPVDLSIHFMSNFSKIKKGIIIETLGGLFIYIAQTTNFSSCYADMQMFKLLILSLVNILKSTNFDKVDTLTEEKFIQENVYLNLLDIILENYIAKEKGEGLNRDFLMTMMYVFSQIGTSLDGKFEYFLSKTIESFELTRAAADPNFTNQISIKNIIVLLQVTSERGMYVYYSEIKYLLKFLDQISSANLFFMVDSFRELGFSYHLIAARSLTRFSIKEQIDINEYPNLIKVLFFLVLPYSNRTMQKNFLEHANANFIVIILTLRALLSKEEEAKYEVNHLLRMLDKLEYNAKPKSLEFCLYYSEIIKKGSAKNLIEGMFSQVQAEVKAMKIVTDNIYLKQDEILKYFPLSLKLQFAIFWLTYNNDSDFFIEALNPVTLLISLSSNSKTNDLISVLSSLKIQSIYDEVLRNCLENFLSYRKSNLFSIESHPNWLLIEDFISIVSEDLKLPFYPISVDELSSTVTQILDEWYSGLNLLDATRMNCSNLPVITQVTKRKSIKRKPKSNERHSEFVSRLDVLIKEYFGGALTQKHLKIENNRIFIHLMFPMKSCAIIVKSTNSIFRVPIKEKKIDPSQNAIILDEYTNLRKILKDKYKYQLKLAEYKDLVSKEARSDFVYSIS